MITRRLAGEKALTCAAVLAVQSPDGHCEQRPGLLFLMRFADVKTPKKHAKQNADIHQWQKFPDDYYNQHRQRVLFCFHLLPTGVITRVLFNALDAARLWEIFSAHIAGRFCTERQRQLAGAYQMLSSPWRANVRQGFSWCAADAHQTPYGGKFYPDAPGFLSFFRAARYF